MEKVSILNLCDDFCGACDSFYVQSVVALQFYINRMTVYTHLVKTDDKTLSLANTIFNQCLQREGRKENEMDESTRLSNVEYVRGVVKIIMSKDGRANKEKRYKVLIKQWYEVIKTALPPKTIETSGGFTVVLTSDFCILCNIFRCTPIEVLQYYINHVSMPKYIASTGKNPFVYATSFFLQYPSIVKQIDAS